MDEEVEGGGEEGLGCLDNTPGGEGGLSTLLTRNK